MAAPVAAAPAAGAALKGKLGSALKRRAIAEGLQAPTDSENRGARAVVAAALVFGLLILLLVALVVALVQAAADALNPFNGDPDLLKELHKATGIPIVYMPIYGVAAEHYEVNPFLIASIHAQETGFSTNPTTSHGRNSDGCCAGPMQFNIDAGTWDAYKNSFRPLAEQRPEDYPLDRRSLPSCEGLPAETGCVYDDFDAITAAANKLHSDGADKSLYSEGTRQAVCDYIGACEELDNCSGPNAYCDVLPRARRWEDAARAIMPPEPGPLPRSGGRLSWPTPPAFRTVVSPFGYRKHPVTGTWKLHTGIDIAAPGGTPIGAAEAGIVTLVCQNVSPCSGYGNFVCVQHRPKLSTCYAHMTRFASAARVGAPVDPGEVIGYVGSTGLSTGDHLHFEVRLGRYPAEPVNPMAYLKDGSTS